MAAETPKIAVYSLPDLKNTTDDALPNYLTSIGFKQSQLLSNIRLALQSSMVAIAGVAFYLDYTKDWSETKDFTLWAVVAYFLLSAVVTGLVWLVENGMVFQGTFGDETLTLRTRTEKHDPTYYVSFSTTSSSSEPVTVSVPFSTFFTSDGHFVAPPFQTWLASHIPIIGTADPARAKLASQSVVESSGAEANSKGREDPAAASAKKRSRGARSG
ncbi:MAG: hypothetical protein M4579_003979 [Chaenotheca gracillima]|nr:MAG: hypothetical protein M4579_003979 [Chaenotheca gracillima]